MKKRKRNKKVLILSSAIVLILIILGIFLALNSFQEKSWQDLISFKGTGSIQTDPFKIEGDRINMTFTIYCGIEKCQNIGFSSSELWQYEKNLSIAPSDIDINYFQDQGEISKSRIVEFLGDREAWGENFYLKIRSDVPWEVKISEYA